MAFFAGGTRLLTISHVGATIWPLPYVARIARAEHNEEDEDDIAEAAALSDLDSLPSDTEEGEEDDGTAAEDEAKDGAGSDDEAAARGGGLFRSSTAASLTLGGVAASSRRSFRGGLGRVGTASGGALGPVVGGAAGSVIGSVDGEMKGTPSLSNLLNSLRERGSVRPPHAHGSGKHKLGGPAIKDARHAAEFARTGSGNMYRGVSSALTPALPPALRKLEATTAATSTSTGAGAKEMSSSSANGFGNSAASSALLGTDTDQFGGRVARDTSVRGSKVLTTRRVSAWTSNSSGGVVALVCDDGMGPIEVRCPVARDGRVVGNAEWAK